MAKKPRVIIRPPKVNLSSAESPAVPLMPKWRAFIATFVVLPTVIIITAMQFAPMEICANIPLLPLRFDNRACLRNRAVSRAQAQAADTPTTTVTPQPTATGTATFLPTLTATPASAGAAMAQIFGPTYTPYPTYTPFPSPSPTTGPTPLVVPADDMKPLVALSDITTAPRMPSSKTLPTLAPPPTLRQVQLQPITVTATIEPTPTKYWEAYRVVNMDVRTDATRDGSSVVRNILLDAQDNVTHSLDIKCRMSNHSQDLRVNEPDSQKTIIENGVPAYAFYINQPSDWDVQFYQYVSEKQAIDISELLKLPVGQNQIIEIYWQFGKTPLVDHAAVEPGPGVDNGRSAPVPAAPDSAPRIVKETVVVVITATPPPSPTITPWIIRVTNTPYSAPTRTALPTGSPEPTYTPLVLPTSTPAPYPLLTATPLVPLTDSATAARRVRVYLPLVMKNRR